MPFSLDFFLLTTFGDDFLPGSFILDFGEVFQCDNSLRFRKDFLRYAIGIVLGHPGFAFPKFPQMSLGIFCSLLDQASFQIANLPSTLVEILVGNGSSI